MITALDTSVLLDVLVNDPKHADRSEALLFQVYQQGSLIISPAVYAELVPQARSRDELDGWLRQVRIQVVPFTVPCLHVRGCPCGVSPGWWKAPADSGRLPDWRPRLP